jgi:dephospho-CoA kinase
MRLLALVLVGWAGSGKSTLARLLSNRGFHSYAVSDAIRSEAVKSGGAEILTEEELRIFAESYRSSHGRSIFVDLILNRVEEDRPPRVAIEGVRSLRSAELIRQRLAPSGYQIQTIGIECAPTIREQRAALRSRGSVAIHLEADNPSYYADLPAMILNSDVLFNNEGSMQDLERFSIQLSLSTKDASEEQTK